jgi:hypothetical protein
LTIILGLLMGHLFDLAYRAARHLVLQLRWYGPGQRCLEHS